MCPWNIGLIDYFLIFSHSRQIMVQAFGFFRTVHLEPVLYDRFAKIHIYQYRRESRFCQHLPQIYRYGTFALIRQAAGQHNLMCIFSAELDVNTQAVHCLFHCIWQFWNIHVKLFHPLSPLFLECASSSESATCSLSGMVVSGTRPKYFSMSSAV